MKTFTSLFALLLFVLSASAETYNLSIWYETTNLRTDKLPNIHMFIDNNTQNKEKKRSTDLKDLKDS